MNSMPRHPTGGNPSSLLWHSGRLTDRPQTTLAGLPPAPPSGTFTSSPGAGPLHSLMRAQRQIDRPKGLQNHTSRWEHTEPFGVPCLKSSAPALPGLGHLLGAVCAFSGAVTAPRFSYSILPRYVRSYFSYICFTHSRAAAVPRLPLPPGMWHSSWHALTEQPDAGCAPPVQVEQLIQTWCAAEHWAGVLEPRVLDMWPWVSHSVSFIRGGGWTK